MLEREGKPIIIEGVPYKTQSIAAMALGITPQAVSKRALKKPRQVRRSFFVRVNLLRHVAPATKRVTGITGRRNRCSLCGSVDHTKNGCDMKELAVCVKQYQLDGRRGFGITSGRKWNSTLYESQEHAQRNCDAIGKTQQGIAVNVTYPAPFMWHEPRAKAAPSAHPVAVAVAAEGPQARLLECLVSNRFGLCESDAARIAYAAARFERVTQDD